MNVNAAVFWSGLLLTFGVGCVLGYSLNDVGIAGSGYACGYVDGLHYGVHGTIQPNNDFCNQYRNAAKKKGFP